jgi:hypothetical protein
MALIMRHGERVIPFIPVARGLLSAIQRANFSRAQDFSSNYTSDIAA